MTLVFAAVLLLACSTHASGSGRRLSDGDGVVASDKQLPPVRQSVKTLGPALGAYSFMAALMDGNETWCGGTLIRSKVSGEYTHPDQRLQPRLCGAPALPLPGLAMAASTLDNHTPDVAAGGFDRCALLR